MIGRVSKQAFFMMKVFQKQSLNQLSLRKIISRQAKICKDYRFPGNNIDIIVCTQAMFGSSWNWRLDDEPGSRTLENSNTFEKFLQDNEVPLHHSVAGKKFLSLHRKPSAASATSTETSTRFVSRSTSTIPNNGCSDRAQVCLQPSWTQGEGACSEP